jgi:hypothetical protein
MTTTRFLAAAMDAPVAGEHNHVHAHDCVAHDHDDGDTGNCNALLPRCAPDEHSGELGMTSDRSTQQTS